MSHNLGIPVLTTASKRVGCGTWWSSEWIGICPTFCTPLSLIRLHKYKQTTTLSQGTVQVFTFSLGSSAPVCPDENPLPNSPIVECIAASRNGVE